MDYTNETEQFFFFCLVHYHLIQSRDVELSAVLNLLVLSMNMKHSMFPVDVKEKSSLGKRGSLDKQHS